MKKNVNKWDSFRRKYFGSLVLYIIIGAIIGAVWFLYYFNKKLSPNLIRCAEDEVERLTVVVVNNSIRKYLSEHSLENLLQIKNQNGEEMKLIRYDTKVLNQFTSEVTKLLEEDLQYMIRGDFDSLDLSLDYLSDAYYEKLNSGILFTVSMGSATGNGLLANIGPKIPINLLVIGNVLSNVRTKVTDYGMNNAMVEVILDLKVRMVIQMPFMSKKVTVKNSIPLTMEIIQGNIPSYYFDSSKK